MADRERVGLIGVGNMGGPMARCLAKRDHPVMLYDTRPDVTRALAAESNLFTVAPDLKAMGAECRTIITMLPDSRIVRLATFGNDGAGGFAAGARRGGVVIDMSSSYPIDTQKLGAELAERGIALVDAPVSGGVPKAITGTLAIMAGGKSEDIDRVEPVLQAMGTVLRTGALGTGHAMKALNNYVSAAGLMATAEALVVGQRFGLAGETMVQVLNASTGKNNTTENKAARYMLSHAFNSGFALALMDKDVGMANRLAEELGIEAAELGFMTKLLGKILAELGANADHTAVYDYAERKAGLKT